MIQRKNIIGLASAVKLIAALMLSILFLSGCSNGTLNQRASSSVVVHNQLPKTIQLLDLHTNLLSTGLRVKGNIKFSARKCRNNRPRGTLTLRAIQPDGTEITSKNVKLNRQGRMSNYSWFDVTLNGSLPTGSHLYLSYVR